MKPCLGAFFFEWCGLADTTCFLWLRSVTCFPSIAFHISMLSSQCSFFLLYALCTAYTPHHHIYVMNDVYDLASLVPFCLPVFIYSCPLWLPLSETALFFLLEMFHLTTAAVVTLFLLYIFSHLNSPDAWEPLLLHISLTLSLKLFQGVSFHHFQIISFLFSIEIRYSHRYSKYHFSCIWQAIGLFSHGSAVLCQQHLSWFLFST